MTPEAHLDRLRQRRDWLTARIAAKKSVNWETIYDESERDALRWAIVELEVYLDRQETEANPAQKVVHGVDSTPEPSAETDGYPV